MELHNKYSILSNTHSAVVTSPSCEFSFQVLVALWNKQLGGSTSCITFPVPTTNFQRIKTTTLSINMATKGLGVKQEPWINFNTSVPAGCQHNRNRKQRYCQQCLINKTYGYLNDKFLSVLTTNTKLLWQWIRYIITNSIDRFNAVNLLAPEFYN
jgi:hypothetical protein